MNAPTPRTIRRYVTMLRVLTGVLLIGTLVAASAAGEIHRLWEPTSVWMFVVGFLLGTLTVRRLW